MVIELYLLGAVALLVMGVVIGVVLIVSIGIHRDERAFRRGRVNATGYAAEGARRLLVGRCDRDPRPEPGRPVGRTRGSDQCPSRQSCCSRNRYPTWHVGK